MLKKIFFILLALFSLVGCQPPQGQDTIVVWHWMTDRHKALEELARRYEQETGIKVRFELYAPSDIYSQKIIAAAQARILPDVFGILDKKIVIASFIDGGFVADLTADFAADNGEWEKKFFPHALAGNRFASMNVYRITPGIYGVPLDIMNVQMLYNKRLLKKAGIGSPPKNFSDFLSAAKSLKRVGIPGMVSGWGEIWMIDCFASNYAFNIMGEEKIMRTYRNEVPYTDPDWIKVFDVFRQLRDGGAFAEGIVTKTNKFAEQDFALERAAFNFNGAWAVNVYNDMNPRLEYGVLLPPPINPDLPMRIWGGAGSSFHVNATSPRKTKAIEFLKWLTDTKQQVYLAQATRNLPANRLAAASLPNTLAEFAAAMDSTTHPTIWPENEDPLVIEAFARGIQSIIIGERTPQEVAAAVEQVKQKQVAKKRKRR